MQPTLAVHVTAAITALIIGAVQLGLPKGTRIHKKIGWLWLLAMTTAALSSFWLYGLFINSRFSPIHILSAWVLVCVAVAVYFARKKNIRRHKRFTVGAYLGLLAAGIGTMAPGRLLHGWLFGG